MQGAKTTFIILSIAVLLGLTIITPSMASTSDFSATQVERYSIPQAVTGRVYQDDNINGTFDAGENGIEGVTVTAYDSTGAVADTATTATDGTYTLTHLTDGEKYRIEFTNAPSGLKAGPQGDDSHTTVFFITAPETGVDAGFYSAADYCQEEPDLVTPIILQGDGDTKSLVSFPYTAYTNQWNQSKPKPTELETFDNIGSTWGLAHQRSSNSIFIGAYMKRHTPFGPGGTGMIYRYDQDDDTLEQFLDLNTLFPGSTGTDPHPAGTNYDHDNNAWDPVGKISLGDIDISGDELTLWAINLNDRLLYEIPLHNVMQPTAPTTASEVHRWPEDTTTGTNLSDLPGLDDCPDTDTDIRPFGLKEHDGKVYVGLVCSAESTQDRDDLRAYVYEFDPDTHTFTQVLNFPLNYGRGRALKYSNGDYRGANWQYWRTTGNLTPTNGQKNVVWPQPMLSDIEFYHGDMIIGLRDRLGDQTGYKQYLPNSSTQVSGVTAGDILRASPDGTGGWVIENNAQGSTFGPSSGANTGQGPGGGEFYYRERFHDAYVDHDETSMGALVQVDSLDEIVVTSMDPVDGSAYSYYSGGIKWMSHATGNVTQVSGNAHQYQLTGEFGKSHGLGDLEALCDPPPIEIGNRVWFDKDGDGIQDPDEAPLEGVTVVLKDPDGNVIGTAVTDANGEYFFSSDPNRTSTDNAIYGIDELVPNTTGYTIEIDLDQTPLQGLGVTDNDTDTSTNGDARDSDGKEEDNKSVVTFDTGPVGENNHTYDFGFEPAVAIGNRVWFDEDNDGIMDDDESPLDDVKVQLYIDRDGDGIPEPGGDDGPPIYTTTTSGGGYYQFTGLKPSDPNDSQTNYFVAIPIQNNTGLNGYGYSSSGSSESPDTTDEKTTSGDNQGDDGYVKGNYVVSNPIAATLNGQTTDTDEADAEGYTDENSYFTIDFGFTQDQNAVSLKSITANNSNAILWGVVMLLLGIIALASFLWRRQKNI